MATRTFAQDARAVSRDVGDGFAAFGTYLGAGLRAMGPTGRRLALTAFGAVLSLSLGAATASAFRLPSAVTDPAQPQDQMLAQSELPSDAAARAYAMENPPIYRTAADRTEDALPFVQATADASQPEAAPTSAAAYSVPAEQTSTPDSNPVAATPATAPTVDADNARQS